MSNKAEVDNIFLALIEQGHYSVDRDGTVRNRFGKPIGQKTPVVVYKKDGQVYTIAVYRLVWIVYKGPVPDGSLVYRINTSKGCGVDNLEMLSVAEFNRRLAKPNPNTVTGSKNGFAAFTDSQVLMLRHEYKAKPFSLRIRAEELKTNRHTLSRALRGETYTNVPDPITKISKVGSGERMGSTRQGISMANRKPRMHVVEPWPAPHIVSNKSVPAKALPLDTVKPENAKLLTTVKTFTKEELQIQNTLKPRTEPSTLPTIEPTYKTKTFTAEDKKKRLELIRERSARMKRY